MLENNNAGIGGMMERDTKNSDNKNGFFITMNKDIENEVGVHISQY